MISTAEYPDENTRFQALMSQLTKELCAEGYAATNCLIINGHDLQPIFTQRYLYRYRNGINEDARSLRIGYHLYRDGGSWNKAIWLKEPKRGFDTKTLLPKIVKFYEEHKVELFKRKAAADYRAAIEAIIKKFAIKKNKIVGLASKLKVEFTYYDDRVGIYLPRSIEPDHLESLLEAILMEFEVYVVST